MQFPADARLKGRIYQEALEANIQADARSERRAEALRQSIGWLCEVVGVPVDAALEARLAQADLAALEGIVDSLRTRRALPSD